MNIFYNEDIIQLVLFNLDLKELVIVKNVNKCFLNICNTIIQSKTKKRKEFLYNKISDKINKLLSILSDKKFNLEGNDYTLFKILQQERNRSEVKMFIQNKIQNNEIEIIMNIFEFIFYKILSENFDSNFDSNVYFMIWEQIASNFAIKYNYSWINGDPFFDSIPYLNKKLFNIYTIPFIMDDLKKNRNPWKRKIFVDFND